MSSGAERYQCNCDVGCGLTRKCPQVQAKVLTMTGQQPIHADQEVSASTNQSVDYDRSTTNPRIDIKEGLIQLLIEIEHHDEASYYHVV
ncbi:hypothetical protein J6590_024584 [Homalodisca vitripennis]|nr:hypothetical protein J6590_024584 [Homalodisca vitripennis]